jgi:hypothetical protein
MKGHLELFSYLLQVLLNQLTEVTGSGHSGLLTLSKSVERNAQTPNCCK